MYVSLLFSNWYSNLFSPCTGIFSTHDLMIHPVSNTILPSVMCNWSLVLCLVGRLYLLWFSWFFFILFFFLKGTCLALHEATARAWHLLMCRDLSQFFVPVKAPSRVPLWRSCCRAEPYPVVKVLQCRRAEVWSMVHSFLHLKLGSFRFDVLDQNSSAREVYSFLQGLD